MRVTFLGTGTSHGVPVIACDCEVCTSKDPRNARTRASIYVAHRGAHVLVDVAPEFRLQCLANDVRRIDAVLLTHAHADHIFGIDDLRRFNHVQGAPVSIYGEPATLQRVRRAFSYAFEDGQVGGGKPQLELREIDGDLSVGDIPIRPLRVWHGEVPVTAYRFGRFGYVTDTSRIPAETLDALQGLHTLVIDALRYRRHSTHFNVEQALAALAVLRPERAYLTHMTHDLEYGRLCAELPDGIEPAYDGLVVEVD